MAILGGGHQDAHHGNRGGAESQNLVLYPQRLWVPGTASLRSWAENDGAEL